MRRRYVGQWLAVLLLACAGVAWVAVGTAYYRRWRYEIPAIAKQTRTESQFVAVLLPRVSPGRRHYAMSVSDLAELLERLSAEGYVTIGLEDVAAFYAGRRRLPPKALLLGYAEDNPTRIALFDRVMKRLRLRGVVFLDQVSSAGNGRRRSYLTAHAIRQMRLSGGWDIGWISQESPPEDPTRPGTGALLDNDGRRPPPSRPERFPIRFRASEMGLNDERDAPRSLHILALRPERSPNENQRVVRNSWTRQGVLVDNFRKRGMGADWTPGWGIVSMGGGRLALLPTPRQSGAGVFLRGSDKWRDVVVEFELKRYQKEFWAYARYKEDGSFIRLGARNGYWYVEQKIGARHLPSVLARAPIVEGSLPARVRFVLKGDSAIVHINDRMQFGRSLDVHPGLDRGRLLLGVYDARSHAAMAVLTSVRAGSLGETWVAPRAGGPSGFDENSLAELREEAVYARALSPRWIGAGADGGVSVAQTQSVLIRSLAGFYGCRLVPMADLSELPPSTFASAASSARLSRGLVGAADELSAIGLNVRLGAGDVARAETGVFLARLRDALHSRRRELWVTVDGPARPETTTWGVDGVLVRSARKEKRGLWLLAAASSLEAVTRQ